MDYGTGEALILTAVRAHASYSADNSTRGDYGVRLSGKGVTYAILRPGETTRERFGLGGNRVKHHRTIVDMRRWYQGPDDITGLKNAAETLADHLDKYRVIGDTTGAVIQAQVETVGEMVANFESADAAEPYEVYIEVVVAWDEEKQITFS